MGDFSRLERLNVLLAAFGAFCGMYAVGSLAVAAWEQWRRQLVSEAEMEVEEMLMQLPAAKILNFSLMIAGVLAILTFIGISSSGRRFNWEAGALFSGLVMIIAILVPRQVLKFLKKRRLERFNDQLEEALNGMGNSLKAGFSIIQAIEAVVRQNRNPISLEFKLMMQQTHLGMSLDEALRNMAKRVESEDFYLVASAVSTARQTGGDLTGIFERLAAMIRERLRIQRRVRSLTAQGRLQAIVLGALPMLLLFVLFLMAPDKIIRFFTNPIGVLIFIIVLILEVCGFLVIRKIVNIDI